MEPIHQKLRDFWISNDMDFSSSTTLLAVSGGMDSMLLAELFLSNKFSFAIAHMNYQHRGSDSTEDAEFVKNWADKNGITFHLKVDNLKSAKGRNTQISARNARYQWFEELMTKNGYTYLATAHHLQDSLETTLINLGRGTGTKGLMGIPLQRSNILRPLLILAPNEKQALSKALQVQWRTDKSNSEDKYLRNKIRHKVIPELVNIFPNFFHSHLINLNNLKSDYQLILELVDLYAEKMVHEEQELIKIDLSVIQDHSERNHLLFHLLQSWNFSLAQIKQFWIGFPSTENKFFNTSKIAGTLKENILTLRQKGAEVFRPISIAKGTKNIETIYGILTIDTVDTPQKFMPNTNEAYFDLEQMFWPLLLSKWSNGDTFQPFGMNGKHQKIQDFFSNNKYTEEEKRSQLLLSSEAQIIWIVGKRTSQHLAVKDGQQQCFKLTWKSNP